jgi:hypothetical protein
MGDSRRLDDPGDFEVNWLRAKVVEQADSCAEQDRHQVDVDLVQKLGLEALLHGARGAYLDVLVTRRVLCLTNRALDPIGDERERRSPSRPIPPGLDG